MQLRVPLTVCRVHVARGAGTSLEEQARIARHAAFAAGLHHGEVLLTAHHADDQLETMLLQLLRGAGVAGLAAMPECTRFAAGRHARPLLTATRAQLRAWLQKQGLAWIEDDSNDDGAFDRNYLRAAVMPALLARWPGAPQAAARSARHCGEAQLLLAAVAAADVARAQDGAALDAASLRALPVARRAHALRAWITGQGYRAPDTRRLAEIAGPLLAARIDAQPHVSWQTASGAAERVVVSRHHGRLILHAAAGAAHAGPEHAGVAEGTELVWQPHATRRLELPAGSGALELREERRGPIDLDALPQRLTVRARAGGEHLQLDTGAPRSLKKLLQNARVVPAERARMPLLYAQGKLVAAGELWLDRSLRAGARTLRRARLHWMRAP